MMCEGLRFVLEVKKCLSTVNGLTKKNKRFVMTRI